METLTGKYLTPETIDIHDLLKLMRDDRAGAVIFFSGDVRNHNHGRQVTHLEYEAFPEMAEKNIAAILEEASEKWPLLKALAMHRVGRVDVGETAVVVITASAHRDAAYAANRHIIDRIKSEVPIWKKEFFADGTCEWSRQCGH